MTKHLLVFGSTGLLGQALLQAGTARGYSIVGAARRNAECLVDITDESGVRKVILEVRPDAVINAAGLINIDECERNPDAALAANARGVVHLVSVCRSERIRLLHVSTDHFFSGDADRLHDENAPVCLVNEYARSKRAGELFALEVKDALVVRTNFTGIRGWPGRPTFFEWTVESLLARGPMALFYDFFTSTIDVDTCAKALLDAADAPVNGILNIACRRAVSKKVFVEEIAKALQIDLDWSESKSVRSLKVSRAESLGLDVSRAEAVLGYRLPDVGEVVTSLVASWRERHAVRH